MKMYKIAIIGCGKVAHLHAKAIGNLPNATLAAAWSLPVFQESAEKLLPNTV